MLKIIIFSLFTTLSFANETGHKEHGYKKSPKEAHDHAGEKKDAHGDDHKDEHKDEPKDEHKDEHGEEGHGDHDDHDKEASAEGFKLNEASVKTFGLVTLAYKGPSVIISKEAIFKSLNEVNLYRLRNGFYKRIDFKTLSQTSKDITVSSADLVAGDQIIVKGIGFLRIAEIAATGGLSDSHSH